MPTLYLLRHAKSSWDDPTLDDHDRPLAPRGRRACDRLHRYCAESGIEPDLVLCSTATRARETVALVVPGHPNVVFDGRLYLASGESLRARIGGLSGASVMLVGHNPGLHDVLLSLADASPLRDDIVEKLPTGALATLELAAWNSPTAELVALALPRNL